MRPAHFSKRPGDEPCLANTEMEADIMAMNANRENLLERVREGMKVIDSAGDAVGKVSYVQLADPDAAVVDEDLGDADTSILGIFDPNDDRTVTERMAQRGYIRIDAAGFFEGDKYVLADDVAGVEGDVVRLSMPKDAIRKPA
jgi:hypothetical protein